MEPTQVTETSDVKIQTPGKFPEESTLDTQHGESQKTYLWLLLLLFYFILCWYCLLVDDESSPPPPPPPPQVGPFAERASCFALHSFLITSSTL
jgi:hypothetical protein